MNNTSNGLTQSSTLRVSNLSTAFVTTTSLTTFPPLALLSSIAFTMRKSSSKPTVTAKPCVVKPPKQFIVKRVSKKASKKRVVEEKIVVDERTKLMSQHFDDRLIVSYALSEGRVGASVFPLGGNVLWMDMNNLLDSAPQLDVGFDTLDLLAGPFVPTDDFAYPIALLEFGCFHLKDEGILALLLDTEDVVLHLATFLKSYGIECLKNNSVCNSTSGKYYHELRLHSPGKFRDKFVLLLRKTKRHED